MKKFLLLALTITLKFQAQIPNSGFETWVNSTGGSQTYQEPQSWTSADPLENLFNPSYTVASVVQTSQSHSGTKAALLQTAIGGGDTVGGILISTGSVATFFGSGMPGFPYTTRPSSLQAYYKFTPVGGDQAAIAAILTKWNSGTNTRDTVAIGVFISGTAVGSYAPASVPLTYNLNLYPDTATIEILIQATGNTTHAGTQFYVDDLSFLGSVPFGIEGFRQKEELGMYPNPSTGTLRIDAEGEIGDVQISNDLGELVIREELNGRSALMDIGMLPPGVYTVRARGITRKLIKQ